MLRLLIVDDEPLARLRLRGLVEDLGAAARPGEAPARVAAEAGEADTALALLRTQPFDVVLLDIRMPGHDGLRLASALRALPDAPAVVFVTAHAEHAVRAFELDAVDYLTKPVRRERLLEALQRARQRRAAATSAAAAAAAMAAAATASASAAAAPVSTGEPPVLVVAERDRVLRLPLPEVLVLKAGQKYVTVRTASRSYVIDESLTELEQRLGGAFLRIHRNALVARSAIRALERRDLGDEEAGGEGWAVRVAPLDEWLAVSRRQLAAVRHAMAAPGA
jgi:two-component system response regulator AlgR